MAKTKFSEKSTLSKSIQPILIVTCLLLFAYIGYRVYVAIQSGIEYIFLLFLRVERRADVRSAHENLKKRGVTMEGSKANIRVKGIDNSRYLDETQKYGYHVNKTDDRAFVSAWNNAETKGYYSRLWSKQDKPEKKK